MNERRGTVTATTDTDATVTMDDGSRKLFSVPELILVEVGMSVTIVDTGDGKPIYKWGD